MILRNLTEMVAGNIPSAIGATMGAAIHPTTPAITYDAILYNKNSKLVILVKSNCYRYCMNVGGLYEDEKLVDIDWGYWGQVTV